MSRRDLFFVAFILGLTAGLILGYILSQAAL